MSERGKLRGVIFDLGGTLIVSPQKEEENIAHLLAWAAGRGLPAATDAAATLREARQWMWDETRRTGLQRTAGEALERAGGRLGWPTHAAFLEEATIAFFTPEVKSGAAFPGAMAALVAIADLDLRMAVASNASDQHVVEDLLMTSGLAHFLDPVVSSAGVGVIKPSPKVFEAVLEDWGAPAETCVMVGDDLDADIAGADALGMRTIWITPDPAAARSPRVAPSAIVTSLADVARTVRAWVQA
jgi:FMN phosphatase YigB (HAD superfamily)